MSLILSGEFEPHKKCGGCGLMLPRSEFHRRKKNGCRLQSLCKSCETARRRRRKEENPDYIREFNNRPHTFAYRLLARAKDRAKRSEMPFDIPLEWAKERIATGVCEASGVPFCLDITARHLLQPSIDRIDNDPAIGYVLGNVRMVVLMVNHARNICNDEDFFVDCFLEVADGFAMKKIHAT
jgi:hypothetical protein